MGILAIVLFMRVILQPLEIETLHHIVVTKNHSWKFLDFQNFFGTRLGPCHCECPHVKPKLTHGGKQNTSSYPGFKSLQKLWSSVSLQMQGDVFSMLPHIHL